MPFKSEKQRKWMWANDPEMAKKWEKEEKMKKETKVRQLIRKMVREIMSEDFAGAYPKEKRAKFDKMRQKQSEVLGYKLMGIPDVKTEIDDATIKEGKTLWELTEQYVINERIESDVDRAARKLGIKFKKSTDTLRTNKYSNPKGDIKRMGSDLENIKMNSWFTKGSVDMSNYKELGEKLAKMLKGRYKLLKVNTYSSGKAFNFINKKKDPKSKFRITYMKSAAGPYISYTGVKGQ